MNERIVLGVLGLDQHEVAALGVAQLLTRHGFEVIYLGRHQTPASFLTAALQEDADLIGVSCHSWEYEAYVDELVAGARDAQVGLVLGGSVLTAGDAASLRVRGVDAVFGAGATDEEIIASLRELVARRSAPRTEPTETPLADQVILITGAGRGLGRAYARLAAGQGAAVICNDLDEDAVAEVVAAIGAEGGQARPDHHDVSDPAGAAAAVDTAVAEFGRLDGLVANAGILRSGPLVHVTMADIDSVIRVHLLGTIATVRAAGAHWRDRAKAGEAVAASVVTTTSSAGLYGFVGEAAYSAAKGGIASFTLVAAAELERYGVTVNAIAPAARTRMTAWMGEASEPPEADPMAPEHVAPLVTWLLGPEARDVTGTVFEAGAGTVRLVSGWHPVAELPLPPLASPATIGQIARQLLAQAPEPEPIWTPGVSTLG